MLHSANECKQYEERKFRGLDFCLNVFKDFQSRLEKDKQKCYAYSCIASGSGE